MSDRVQLNEEDSRRLVVAITDFLREQLNTREELLPEDRDCLEIAIQCLEMAYGLDPNGYVHLRFSRPLLDIFMQVINPVPVRDRLRADAHKDDGNDYMRRHMFQNAENEYTAAIELDRWNSIYYCNRAGARIEQQNFYEAIADCRQALMLNPDYAKAYGRMGQAYASLNRPREAARCFRQALQLDPRNERYRNNLGVAERQLHRSDVLGIFSGVLGSIFGAGPQTLPRVSSNTQLPPSFMIFTDRPRPVVDSSQRNIQPSQNDGKATKTEEKVPESSLHVRGFPSSFGVTDDGRTPNIARRVPAGSLHDPGFPSSFVAIDSISDPSSTVQEDPASDTEDNVEEDGEILMQIPSYSFFPDVVPVKCPDEKAYNFDPNDNKPGKASHDTTCPEADKIPHEDTPDTKTDGSLGIEKILPKTEKEAESSKFTSSESIENVAKGPPKIEDGVSDDISSHTLDESLGIESSQTKLKKDKENSNLSSLESNKNVLDDKSKGEDSDLKQTTDEKPFVVSWPSNEEWDKYEEDDKRGIESSTPDTELPASEKSTDNDSGAVKDNAGTVKKTEDEQKYIPESSSIKKIETESELFNTIQNQQVSSVSKSNEEKDVKSDTAENESSDKSDNSN